ncbi:ABC transporter permease [Desulfovibrio sp. OttesenSCG-928-O18]|nr:ABC transporter permease [Desulfovibrio sp. OttesenSCG-928-O18]
MKKTGHRIRLAALILKETRQMVRDKSTLTLGIILPGLLIILFGYGLSLDVTLVPVAVVRDTAAPATRDLLTALSLSRYFAPVPTTSMQEAEKLLRAEKVDAIVRRDPKESGDGSGAVQIILNGRDANKSRIIQRYLESAVALWAEKNAPADRESGGGTAVAESRVWYNHAMESSYFLVPGVVMLVMTLIGSLLTALVMAREWERGTFEALLATPVTVNEIVTGKIVPYFLLGMAGLSICLAASSFLFGVPIRGSLPLLVAGSALYLLVALGIGLFISAAVKSQFLASQIVLVFCFLPTLMLSGFIFDLQSAPAAVYYIAHVFPATWYVDLIQTLFLVGDVPFIIARDFAVLAAFAALMLGLARAATRKSLE